MGIGEGIHILDGNAGHDELGGWSGWEGGGRIEGESVAHYFASARRLVRSDVTRRGWIRWPGQLISIRSRRQETVQSANARSMLRAIGPRRPRRSRFGSSHSKESPDIVLSNSICRLRRRDVHL